MITAKNILNKNTLASNTFVLDISTYKKSLFVVAFIILQFLQGEK